MGARSLIPFSFGFREIWGGRGQNVHWRGTPYERGSAHAVRRVVRGSLKRRRVSSCNCSFLTEQQTAAHTQDRRPLFHFPCIQFLFIHRGLISPGARGAPVSRRRFLFISTLPPAQTGLWETPPQPPAFYSTELLFRASRTSSRHRADRR